MPRAVWTGVVQFVLISFPVKLYKATYDKGVRFKTLHSSCGSYIKLKKWCDVCSREITGEEINKGFEIGRGQTVIFTDEEIEGALPESVKVIKIEKAVGDEEIPAITYDTSYFLAPDKGGEHVYNLLFNALAIRGRVLIGRVIMRNKERIVCIRPYQDGLLLSMLHFADEVRDIHEVVYVKEKKVDSKEVDLAINLLDNLTGSFGEIDQKDKFRSYIENMAQMKAAGQIISVERAKPVIAQINIIEGLQKSIEMVKKTEKVSEILPESIKPEKISELPIKEVLDKMYGVTEEEINSLILDQKIEDEKERIKILEEAKKYKTFEEYVKDHKKEFEGVEISEDFKSIGISNETYPRINLDILKKIGIIAGIFEILIYLKPSAKVILQKEKEKEKEMRK